MAFGDEMYVYEQSNISDAGLALLGRAAAALRVLSLEGRQTITQHGVQQLVLALPSLTALDVRHTQAPSHSPSAPRPPRVAPSPCWVMGEKRSAL